VSFPADAEERLFREISRVREEVEGVSDKFDKLKDGDITTMKVEIAMLKVKAGVWGLLGGMISVGIAILAQLLRSLYVSP
jgi:hypothetical protein